MNFWDFFKVHTHPITERKNHAIIVAWVPKQQISGFDTLLMLDDRDVTKDYLIGEAFDEYLRKRLIAVTETENHIHFSRAPEKKELNLKPETFGMKQAKN